MRQTAALGRILVPVWLMRGLAPAEAQDELAAWHPEAVRAAHDAASADRDHDLTPLAGVVVAGVDKSFFDRPAGRSVLTRDVAMIYRPSDGRALAMSFAVARALTREEIIDWWMHGVFLRQGCYGLNRAATAYFGETPAGLSTADAAALVALAVAPGRLAGQPERLTERRDHILRTMAEMGQLTPEQLEQNLDLPLGLRDPLGVCPPE